MFILESPLYLLLLLMLPTGIYLRHFSPHRGGRVSYPIRIWNGPAPRVPRRLKLKLVIAHFCFWAGLSGIIIALAGPGFAERERVYLNRGIDIMLVVDLSPSMAIQDFGTHNRLVSTQELLGQFVAARENDAIGVVSFGRDAALRLSPTVDSDAVVQTIEQLDIFDHGDATAIGLGLAVAVLHLQHSTAEHQAIIIITDGDNNAGEVSPQAAADMAGEAGIQLYAVGIGTQSSAPIEFVYPDTGTQYRGTMSGAYNTELLNDIAERSGGRVYTAGTQGTLNAILNEIDSLETVERRVRIAVATVPMARVILLFSMLLLFADFCIRKVLLQEVI